MKKGQFCNKIRALRKDMGMIQSKFAMEIGVSKRTVASWETGDAEPHPRRLDHNLERCRRIDSEAVSRHFGGEVSHQKSRTTSHVDNDSESSYPSPLRKSKSKGAKMLELFEDFLERGHPTEVGEIVQRLLRWERDQLNVRGEESEDKTWKDGTT